MATCCGSWSCNVEFCKVRLTVVVEARYTVAGLVVERQYAAHGRLTGTCGVLDLPTILVQAGWERST